MYDDLYPQLQYSFSNASLLTLALSHRSCQQPCNERLEFLGDSILGMMVAQEIFQRFPDMREGDMSRLRSNLVNGDTLSDIALELGLDHYIILGLGEEKSGGRSRPSILADAFEAILAAIYLDGGFNAARKTMLHSYGERLSQADAGAAKKDAKSSLQEWAQSKRYPLPMYEQVCVKGKAHEQAFEMSCRIKGLSLVTTAVSTSRRRGEQLAAKKYLESLDDEH